MEMREMVPGEIGGLTSMYVDKTRSATLLAEGPAEVITFPRAAFQAALAGHPALSRALLAHLGQKVRAKTAQVATLLARSGRDPREHVAFFDTKPYDSAAFEARMPDDLRARYFESRLGPGTAALARGYPVVCAFVNDELDASVLEELARFGTRLVALRCAGYNNVDLAAAAQLHVEVARVPALSPRRRRARDGPHPDPQPQDPPRIQPCSRGRLSASTGSSGSTSSGAPPASSASARSGGASRRSSAVSA